MSVYRVPGIVIPGQRSSNSSKPQIAELQHAMASRVLCTLILVCCLLGMCVVALGKDKDVTSLQIGVKVWAQLRISQHAMCYQR
jgi:hypothetical protein